MCCKLQIYSNNDSTITQDLISLITRYFISGDKVGEGRAYWMLSNVFSNSGQLNKALDNARKFYDLATEMEDNVASAAAKMMINDIGLFAQRIFFILISQHRTI